ncbi:MAG: antibiotic biosynthesis monooxygenase [Salinivirgaceae bacterium]|jgi:quinol monooxygenase YgiN
MITRIIKVKIKPEHLEAFKKYIIQFLKEARDYKNIHHADCFADLDEQFHFHIYTIWQTEGALNKFRRTETNLTLKNNLKEWCSSPYAAWTVENI